MGSHLNDENFYIYFDPQQKYVSLSSIGNKVERLLPDDLKNKEIRIFYAEEISKTWPKLFILTEDNLFYSEYLDNLSLKILKLKFDFKTFKDTDYKFRDYQKIIEINKVGALKTILINQENWLLNLIN